MKSRLKRDQLKMSRVSRSSVENLSLPQTVFRVAVLGSGGVGKTSLITRFVDDQFTEEYHPTVEDLYETSLNLSPRFTAVLDILDTAGSYQFPAMRRLTIEKSDAFVLVYSIDDESSLQEVLRIRSQIQEVRGSDYVPIVLVANKCDIPEGGTQVSALRISKALFEAKAKSDCPTIGASAKYGFNVKSVFVALLTEIALRNRDALSASSTTSVTTNTRLVSLPLAWLKSRMWKVRVELST